MCTLTDWIEAGCGAAMVGLTAWTLAVLRAYAADTKQIALAAAEQIESAQRPFLALQFPGGLDGPLNKSAEGSISNLGRGIALNIEYNIPISIDRGLSWPSPLGVMCEIPFQYVMPKLWDPMQGFALDYDSLSGRRYRTTLQMTRSFQLETLFEEIAPLSARPKPEYEMTDPLS